MDDEGLPLGAAFPDPTAPSIPIPADPHGITERFGLRTAWTKEV